MSGLPAMSRDHYAVGEYINIFVRRKEGRKEGRKAGRIDERWMLERRMEEPINHMEVKKNRLHRHTTTELKKVWCMALFDLSSPLKHSPHISLINSLWLLLVHNSASCKKNNNASI